MLEEERVITHRRMRKEIEDAQSKWGKQMREEWKKIGVRTVKRCCENVEDRCWLASKIGSNKKRKGKSSGGKKDHGGL